MEMQMADRKRLLKDLVVVYLPVKSLLRFRCVSKNLQRLIKSPTFINNHFLQRRNKGSMLLVRRYLTTESDDVLSFCNINSSELEEVLPSLSIPILKDLKYKYDKSYFPPSVHLLGPCKGLVCIASDGDFILCNPALREFKQLSKCPFSCPEDHEQWIKGVGFGNSHMGDFKVVLIRNTNHERYYAEAYNLRVHLYSSRTDSWREVDNEGISMIYLTHFPGSEVFFNGVCHWNASSTVFQNFEDIILSFNISTEDFTQLDYPDCLKVPYQNDTCLTILHECLVLLYYRRFAGEIEMIEPCPIEVWMMKQYGVKESWTKQLVIRPYLVVRPLSSWRQCEWLLVETGDGQLASCALHTNETKMFQIYGVQNTLRALIYKDSLINVNKLTEEEALSEENSAE